MIGDNFPKTTQPDSSNTTGEILAQKSVIYMTCTYNLKSETEPPGLSYRCIIGSGCREYGGRQPGGGCEVLVVVGQFVQLSKLAVGLGLKLKMQPPGHSFRCAAENS